MKIEELPPELLTKIFNYLSTSKNVSLVSRKFYEIVSEINDKNISLTLNHRLLHLANNTLRHVNRNNRKISKVKISLFGLTNDDLKTIISIVSQISATIKYLRIEGRRSIKMAFFIKILSLVPNVEHLIFRRLLLSRSGNISSSEDLNLKHLRNLEIFSCEEQFQVVISRQTTIKKLLLVPNSSDAQFPASILDNLELKSLHISYGHIPTVTLSRQTKLKSLTLDKTYKVDKNLMEVLASSLTELEELKWDVTYTPVNDFVNIERLKNLRHLRLYFFCSRPDIINQLIQLDNSRFATLEISRFGDLADQQIHILATYTPALKLINTVECWSVGKLFSERNVNYLMQCESGNIKLTEICCSILDYETSLLSRMITDFPNLKKLKIRSQNDLAPSQFRLIVGGFTELETLDLTVFSWTQITIDDFKYFRDHRKRLQTLCLRKIGRSYVHRYLKDLEALFGIVKYTRYDNTSDNPSLLIKI